MMSSVFASLWSLSTFALAADPEPPAEGPDLWRTSPRRELIVHGFRAPVTGVELRDGPLGFHLGVYPMLFGDEVVTTWFTKVGVSAYFLSFDTGSGRDSGLYASGSLLQGLTGAHDVTKDVASGTAFSGEAGFRWAAVKGLDVRLGITAVVTASGDLSVNPTPGLSWSVPLGDR